MDAVTRYTHEKVTTYGYTFDGLVHTVAVSDGGSGHDQARTTTTDYNTLDQVGDVIDGAGHETEYTYDAYGNKANATDPNGNQYKYTYDPNGHLTETDLLNYTGNPINPTTATTLVVESRAYDPDGRLQSVTDSLGRITSYTYTDNDLAASASFG